MAVLLSLSIIPIIFSGFFNNYNNKQKKIYLMLCALFMIVVMGLRGRFVGSDDTNNYCKIFEIAVEQTNLKKFLTIRGVYNSNLIFSEIGFYGFVWGIGRVFNHYQFLLILSSLIMIICTIIFIKNNSDDCMLSIVMYITLGLFTFCMNGMRQGIAMSICLIAFDFAKNKKFIPFLITVLFAMLFHKSAIFYLIVYFLFLFKPKFSHIMFFLGLLSLFIIFSNNLISIFDYVVGKDYADSENVESGGIVTVLIYLLVIIFTLITIKDLKNNNIIFTLLLISIIGLVTYLFRYFSIHIIERLSYYFFYSIIILLPSAINKFNCKERMLIKIITITVCLLLFAYRLNGSLFEEYYFLQK